LFGSSALRDRLKSADSVCTIASSAMVSANFRISILRPNLNLRKIIQNRPVQFGLFRKLRPELRLQVSEAFVEVEVVFLVGKPDVAAGGKDVIQGAHPIERGGIAEAFHVLVLALGVSPFPVGSGDPLNVLARKLPLWEVSPCPAGRTSGLFPERKRRSPPCPRDRSLRTRLCRPSACGKGPEP